MSDNEWGKFVRERQERERQQQNHPKSLFANDEHHNKSMMDGIAYGMGFTLGQVIMKLILKLMVLAIIGYFVLNTWKQIKSEFLNHQQDEYTQQMQAAQSQKTIATNGLNLQYEPPKRIIETTQDMMPSAIINLRAPDYPIGALKLGHQGIVSFNVQYDENGTFMFAKLISSSGHGSLDDAALNVIKRSVRLNPLNTLKNVYQRSHSNVIVTCGFKLNGSQPISQCSYKK